MSGLLIRNDPILILFGGTGDLTFRKLLPALYNLEATDRLAGDFKVLVIGRQPFEQDSYHDKMQTWIEKHARLKFNPAVFSRFKDKVIYFKMDFNDSEGYPRLKEKLHELDKDQSKPRLYYLAVAPSSFVIVAEYLRANNLAGQYERDSIIIEKPFGDDLDSATKINEVLESVFLPKNIYRIDHYLAKEMVQNILAIRFANPIFEGIWNNQYIDNIQISAAETVGVELRGNYYDHSGAIKDMVQNHLLQILSIVAMEKPDSLAYEDVQQAQFNLLKSLYLPMDETLSEHIVLGQYHVDQESDKNVSYVHEAKVNAESKTETYVALRLEIDNDRYRGVPIYLRTGKRMHKRSTEIAITFRSHGYFEHPVKEDVLLIKVQPDEGVYFRFNIKKPGQGYTIQPVFMDFCQSCIYENRLNTPEAYERLLYAAFEGDHSLFTSWDIAQNNWQFIETLNQQIDQQNIPLRLYESFSDGPEQARELLAREHRQWVEERVLGDDFKED